MKKQDKEDLIQYKQAIRLAGTLRTFPNGRKLPLFEATAINAIGKLIEYLDYILREIIDGKKPLKSIKIIGDTLAKFYYIIR